MWFQQPVALFLLVGFGSLVAVACAVSLRVFSMAPTPPWKSNASFDDDDHDDDDDDDDDEKLHKVFFFAINYLILYFFYFWLLSHEIAPLREVESESEGQSNNNTT